MRFNKEEFARLLDLAKGRRSINKYGNDSNVDPGYISRLLRCLIDTPPSANIITKLAEKANNNITAEELMIAAGYLKNNAQEQGIEETESDNSSHVKDKPINRAFLELPEDVTEEEKELLQKQLDLQVEIFRSLRGKDKK